MDRGDVEPRHQMRSRLLGMRALLRRDDRPPIRRHEGLPHGFAVTERPEHLTKPMSWRQPRLIFVIRLWDSDAVIDKLQY
jgi:protein gp37